MNYEIKYWIIYFIFFLNLIFLTKEQKTTSLFFIICTFFSFLNVLFSSKIHCDTIFCLCKMHIVFFVHQEILLIRLARYEKFPVHRLPCIFNILIWQTIAFLIKSHWFTHFFRCRRIFTASLIELIMTHSHALIFVHLEFNEGLLTVLTGIIGSEKWSRICDSWKYLDICFTFLTEGFGGEGI